MKYDAKKLYELGYGNVEVDVVELTAAEVADLAHCVGGTVEEIETTRIN